ncbi:MAG: HAD-IA family hydrolase, partial [Opitutales bacterium]
LWERFGRGESWRLLDEVRPTLEKLKEQGYRMAVLSNNDSRLRKVLDDLGIAPFFEHVFVSSELGCGKPDPNVFRSVEEVMGLQSNALLHVGDDPARDAAAARKAGWQAILLTEESGPGLRAREISQLPDLLETLAA